tara:strand:- start:932 stop:2065 length:1134 start_codon:yes stop_codon:yes gene_type:complete
MDLFEYQGKELYKKFNIATPKSMVIDNLEDVSTAIETLNFPLVVKAQVQVGGRGKAGGIRIANTSDELIQYSSSVLGMDIKGYTVNKLLIEEALEISEEYYISFTLDRSRKQFLMLLSSKGGMDIEEVAKNNPDDLIKLHLHPSEELNVNIIRDAIDDAGLNKKVEQELINIISSLYDLFVKGDCDLVEVNPLAVISGTKVLALDSKISLDMNAKFRHEYFEIYENEIPISSTEKEAREKGLNFIKLDGDIGIIGNGAGLVMSTLDIVSLEGGKAANFLDIGGGAKAETVSSALEVLQKDKNVKSVLINIFGGITRCDLVAEGIVEATKNKSLPWPVIVRLDGTNSIEGRKILDDNKNKAITVAKDMKEAAKMAVRV